MAENLVNLEELRILGCDEMAEVIKDDEEKSISGGGQRALLFPKLHTLQLWHLPKLVSFCEWKCDVGLPSLREVEIESCDNMKSFTLGHLNTPNLEIGHQDFGAVKDLNDFLQQQCFNRTEKKQAEEVEKKMEGGEEDQESRGEIEEEEN